MKKNDSSKRNRQIIRDICEEAGSIRPRDLHWMTNPSVTLKRMVRGGSLDQVRHGVYRLAQQKEQGDGVTEPRGKAVFGGQSGEPPAVFQTHLGGIYHGDSISLLKQVPSRSVQLIMTSPPYPLNAPKAYGNVSANRYLEWFLPFAEEFLRILHRNGSLVLEFGGVWNKGRPTKSLYQYELLLMLCKEVGFHLAQDAYLFSPGRLPGPAAWANRDRVRMKESINSVWWVSPTENPKANNRAILSPYSPAMKRLLVRGYKPGKRPSGHIISEEFKHDHGGAIPPNLFVFSDRDSSRYLERCSEHAVAPHPARFPIGLPDFFIRFLTEPEDIVLDPFAGSCTTGEAAERLGRPWICMEASREYCQQGIWRLESVGEPENSAG